KDQAAPGFDVGEAHLVDTELVEAQRTKPVETLRQQERLRLQNAVLDEGEHLPELARDAHAAKQPVVVTEHGTAEDTDSQAVDDHVLEDGRFEPAPEPRTPAL